jgi:hypothetical protein
MKKSLKIEAVSAAVIVACWGVLYVLLVDRDQPRSFASWACWCAVAAFFIYCIRMFLGGAVFSERTRDMDLPSGVIVAVAAVLLAVVAGVLFLFRRDLFGWK